MAAACYHRRSRARVRLLLVRLSVRWRCGRATSFGYTFLADIGLLALALSRKHPARIAAPAGSIVFRSSRELDCAFSAPRSPLVGARRLCAFALIHAGFSVWPRTSKKRKRPHRSGRVYVPLLALVLLFIAVRAAKLPSRLGSVLLIVDIIAVGLAVTSQLGRRAVRSRSARHVVYRRLWIVTAPPVNDSVVGILIVVGSFGVFFSTACQLLHPPARPNES